MARIGSRKIVNIDGPRGDGSFLFIIEYDAIFDPPEIGQEFNDAVRIWESDGNNPTATDPDGDDTISTYTFPERFRADNAILRRTKFITLTGDQVSTEIGDEEVYAWIWLKRVGTGGPPDDEQRTETKTIDD
jgi:hypothetical protein